MKMMWKWVSRGKYYILHTGLAVRKYSKHFSGFIYFFFNKIFFLFFFFLY